MLKPLEEIPGWKKFCKRYRYDITAFAVEVLKMNPSLQQKQLFTSVASRGSRTSVASGHGTGKSRSAGVVALWHLLCFPHSVTMFTAPQIDQLRTVVWKEITICLALLKAGKYAWLGDYVAIFSQKVYIKGHDKTWNVFAKTAPKHQPQNLAGQHGDNYLFWGDEATAIDDAVLEVGMGALTHDDNRAVLTSQPARATGFFYDTHHKLCVKNGGVWNALVFNGEATELVSRKTIREMLMKYGSRDDPGYMIRVRGLFPDLNNQFLLSHKQVRAAYKGRSIRAKDHKGYGYVALVDVGGGTGRDDSVITIARVWGFDESGDYAKRADIIDIPFCRNNDDLYDISGTLKEQIRRYPNLTIVVDTTGAGVGLGQHLTREGISFIPVNWGVPCFLEVDQKIYTNVRAQAIVCFRNAVKAGRFKILVPYHQSKVIEQMAKLPFGFDSSGRYKIPSKEDMRRAGITSPDIVDTFAFIFMSKVYPIPAKPEAMTFNSVQDEKAHEESQAMEDVLELVE